MMLLGKKGMDAQAPIFIRVFKEESELEVWKLRDDGRYYHFKTYPICNWSGDLGPKVKQGDRQAPEGFYTISREQMNPDSKYHLAMNLGYPNTYDRSLGRQTTALSFIVGRPPVEPGFRLERQEKADRQIRYTLHAYATDAPAGLRYRPAGTPTASGAA